MEYVVVRRGQSIDLSKEGKVQCPRCAENGADRSGDNLMVYGLDKNGKDRGAFCWSCDYTIPSYDKRDGKSDEEEEIKIMSYPFNDAVHQEIKRSTTPDSRWYRGIDPAISKFFGVRHEFDEDNNLLQVFYPTTKNYEIVGYKTRIHPKDFTHPYGEVGKDCDMFGQFRFKTFSDTVVIVGGEHDQQAAYQMLLTVNKDKRYNPVAVVSATVGESATHKQIQTNYAFFNQFKKIIVCMDADEAGRKATEVVVKCLPRGKVYVMNMRRKDPNSYLWEKETNQCVDYTQEFVSDFWAAKPYTPAGVHASTSLYEAALERLDLEMVSLPPFMRTAAAMLGGGLVLKEITLILAKTSIGKTTLISALTRHWALHEPQHILGVMSLEADAAKFSQNMLSYHLKVPLHRMDKEQRKEFLAREDIKEQVKVLYEREDGTPTLYVCDDRGASWEQIKEKMLEMIIAMGVTILVVDPYSDLLSGMSVSEQEEVATWFKKVMKEYGITPIIISHVRKGANGAEAGALTEDDAQGSSFLVKAAGQTIALERDKQAEDPLERNRTRITILKNRDFGETGQAGSMYYDYKTANLYDFDEYIRDNPELLVPPVTF